MFSWENSSQLNMIDFSQEVSCKMLKKAFHSFLILIFHS